MKKIIAFLFILASVTCSAQDTIKLYQNNVLKATIIIPKAIAPVVDTAAIVKMKCDTHVTPPVDTTHPPVVITTGIKGLYFDNTSLRLGTQDENTMISLVNRDHFNAVPFYDLSTVFKNSTLKIKLAAFLKKLRQNGVIRNIAIKDANFDDVIAFNDSQTDTLCMFNWLNLEEEYWNNTADPVGAFIKDSADVRKMMSWVGTHGIRGAEQYNGHFKDPLKSRAPGLIAKFQSDAEVHDYAASPVTDYVPYRRDSLNAWYKRLFITGAYIGLHSSEDAFYGDEYASWGLDSVNNVKKKIFESKHYSNMYWAGVYVFDFKWYVKWKPITTSFFARMAAGIFSPPKSKAPLPEGIAEPEHLKMAEEPTDTIH